MPGTVLLKCGCSRTIDEFTNEVISISFCSEHCGKTAKGQMQKIIDNSISNSKKESPSKLKRKCFRVLHTLIGIPIGIYLPFFWVLFSLMGDKTGLIDLYIEWYEFLQGDEPWGPVDGCFSTQKN